MLRIPGMFQSRVVFCTETCLVFLQVKREELCFHVTEEAKKKQLCFHVTKKKTNVCFHVTEEAKQKQLCCM